MATSNEREPMHFEPEMSRKKRTFGISLSLDLENDLVKFGKIFDPPKRASVALRFILEKWQEWYRQQIQINPEEITDWKFAPEKIEMFRLIDRDPLIRKEKR